jgi:hypothetical protein
VQVEVLGLPILPTTPDRMIHDYVRRTWSCTWCATTTPPTRPWTGAAVGELESVSRRAAAPFRLVLRARIVLVAAGGLPNSAIAARLGGRPVGRCVDTDKLLKKGISTLRTR